VTLSTKLFTWDSKSKSFSAEVSTITKGGSAPLPKGITLKNPRTGGWCHFVYVATDKDKEGDVTAFRFASVSPKLTLVLFND
jgi:hypothetical protein